MPCYSTNRCRWTQFNIGQGRSLRTARPLHGAGMRLKPCGQASLSFRLDPIGNSFFDGKIGSVVLPASPEQLADPIGRLLKGEAVHPQYLKQAIDVQSCLIIQNELGIIRGNDTKSHGFKFCYSSSSYPNKQKPR